MLARLLMVWLGEPIYMEGLVYKGDLLSVDIADVMSWVLMRYTLGSGV